MSGRRILGIDPGSVKTGYGVIEERGGKLTLVDAGTISTKASDPLEARLLIIYQTLRGLIEDRRPASVAVEEIFMAKHANAALKLGHARGVALLAAAEAGLSVTPYAPRLVKQAIVGKGSAEKEQVARIVGLILGLKTLPGVDATDALAVAITHAQALRMNQRVLLTAGKKPR
ncbi:MAG: crossover junction endodeoxyribonuclease RuvC [Sandaracinaceae bacterium]|nr:crossover junction endodeoxyribonuclease RuvC [Sandaracinaceae bacterium]